MTFAPSFRQRVNVRAGHAAEKNVADNRDVETFDFAPLSQIVKVSSKPCVGCSCAPSPALMMLAPSLLRKKSAVRQQSCGAAR